jgi:DNA-binding NtrC family response regulator
VSAEPGNSSRHPATVLVVDDDPAYRELMVNLINHLGYRSVMARDGFDAQRQLLREPVDAILTDLTMPDCDGIELLMKVRSSHPHIPVIVTSGADIAATCLPTASLLGAVSTLPKPFEIARLKSLLVSALGGGLPSPTLCS